MVDDLINIHYGKHKVGVLSYDAEQGVGYFEYDPKFVKTGLQLSPIKMPQLVGMVYSFPELTSLAFRGMPGLIADSLPDDFGNAVLNAWMAGQGKDPAKITPTERLRYTATRGMGALEFRPGERTGFARTPKDVALDELVRVAQSIVDDRANFEVTLSRTHAEDSRAMQQLLQVGMSAGGARPKAVVAMDPERRQVKSGQVNVPAGWEHYLLKFDGVSTHQSSSETFGDPLGYGAMEYVYHLMARAAGIDMSPCFLLEEGDRRHFLAKRFDRDGNKKIHMQTLAGLQHVDYKSKYTYSYPEIFQTARKLLLPQEDAEQILRRMIFNIVARNHDDHPKNWAFLMSDAGEWRLSPAYDLAYSYKPGSKWIADHWMTLNGKFERFTLQDLYSIGDSVSIFTARKIRDVLDEVVEAVSQWPKLAGDYDVPPALQREVASNLLLSW